MVGREGGHEAEVAPGERVALLGRRLPLLQLALRNSAGHLGRHLVDRRLARLRARLLRVELPGDEHAAFARWSGTPPRMMSVPRPAMFVAIVTAP